MPFDWLLWSSRLIVRTFRFVIIDFQEGQRARWSYCGKPLER